MTRRPRIGSVFEVRPDSSTVRYFQYIATDSTQMDCHVVRVFSETYSPEDQIDFRQIVAGEVEFYAHVLLGIGIKGGFWKVVGDAPAPKTFDVLFRDTDDYGEPQIRNSKKWFVWKVGKPIKYVGELNSRYQDADIGVIIPPEWFIHRIVTGEYDFVYPGF